MKIQIITTNTMNGSDNIKVNSFASPESLDVYDVNIFDLSKAFWKNVDDNTVNVDILKDIKHIKNMVETASNKNNIIMFPQNTSFRYYYYYIQGYSGQKDYKKNEDLKNCFTTIKKIIKDNFVDYECSLGYEPNKTVLQNKEYKSDFYIINKTEDLSEIISKSTKSNKTTSLKIANKIIITTLDILEDGLLDNYLVSVGIISETAAIPDWINEIEVFNDKELKRDKKTKEKGIASIQKELDKIELSLSTNNEYKTILYETGTKLTTKVNGILGEIFDVNAEKFNDVYEEDFLLKLSDITFVVEIKGVVHNVKGNNVSEAYNHIQVYLDDVIEENKQEKVKGLLIVANQRETNPKDRVAINERQVKIAKRNEMLIVKTEDLLKIYEEYINEKITSAEIKKMFTENVGLLTLEKPKKVKEKQTVPK